MRGESRVRANRFSDELFYMTRSFVLGFRIQVSVQHQRTFLNLDQLDTELKGRSVENKQKTVPYCDDSARRLSIHRRPPPLSLHQVLGAFY